jgi:hypothetical protein
VTDAVPETATVPLQTYSEDAQRRPQFEPMSQQPALKVVSITQYLSFVQQKPVERSPVPLTSKPDFQVCQFVFFNPLYFDFTCLL